MKNKVIAISGSTGFIAGHVIKTLKEYEFIKITRQEFTGDQKGLREKIEKSDMVINLVGAPVLKRWTNRNKKEIFDSRIKTTRIIRKTIDTVNKPIHLLSASAIGIYDGEGVHTETNYRYSEGFLNEVITNWEAEAKEVINNKMQTTIMRIGIVMAKDGGIYKTISPFFNAGFCGKIGTGKQWMSFIHVTDLVNAIKFIIDNNIKGIVNITAPNPVTNERFTMVMAKLLKKQAFMPVPVFVLRMMYGEGASLIYNGQKVIPELLINMGFEFKFPDIESALREIIVE